MSTDPTGTQVRDLEKTVERGLRERPANPNSAADMLRVHERMVLYGFTKLHDTIGLAIKERDEQERRIGELEHEIEGKRGDRILLEKLLHAHRSGQNEEVDDLIGEVAALIVEAAEPKTTA